MFHSCYYLSLKATGTVYFTFMAFPFSVPGFHLGSIFIRRSASLSKEDSTLLTMLGSIM